MNGSGYLYTLYDYRISCCFYSIKIPFKPTKQVFLKGCSSDLAKFLGSNVFQGIFEKSILIKKRNDDVFEVTVVDTITTTHAVTVTNMSLTDLTKNNITKAELLDFSFKFLLDREPNTSILSSFDINVISEYFSDYKDEVRRWCNES